MTTYFCRLLVCAGICFLSAASADTLDREEPWTDEAEYYIPVNDWEPVAALPEVWGKFAEGWLF